MFNIIKSKFYMKALWKYENMGEKKVNNILNFFIKS